METHASHHRELDAVVKVSRFTRSEPTATRTRAETARPARASISGTFLRGDARHG